MEGTFRTVPQALLVAFCGLLIVFILLAALSGIMMKNLEARRA